MERTNVTDNGKTIGWFDLDTAIQYDGTTCRDALGQDSNALLRTKGGRWVLGHFSRSMSNGFEVENDWYEFVTDDQAKNWLVTQDHDDAAEKYFGPVEEESGPGRPTVGPKVETRLPEAVLEQVAGYAQQHSLSRAEALRGLIELGLNCEQRHQQAS